MPFTNKETYEMLTDQETLTELVIYKGVEKQMRTTEGVSKEYQGNIQEWNYESSRIMVEKLGSKDQKLNIVSIGSPENNKPT